MARSLPSIVVSQDVFEAYERFLEPQQRWSDGERWNKNRNTLALIDPIKNHKKWWIVMDATLPRMTVKIEEEVTA